LLQSELSARELKGLIGQADFLVAERIHSIIGSTGVATPFLFLGSRTDARVSGIIVEMLGLPEVVYYLHTPVKTEMFAKFDDLWGKKEKLKSLLNGKRGELLGKLSDVSKSIKEKIV
jgi:polysaccharide pyruvyl transferase WcaK-like protein